MFDWVKTSIVGVAILALPLVFYGNLLRHRPPRTNLQKSLFPGITYDRQALDTPRPIVLHIVTLNLEEAKIRVGVTPGNPTSDRTEITARTTTEFLREFNPILAINANFFFPFRENTPWDYYPKSGDRANAVGLAISDSKTYSSAEKRWSALCFSNRQRAQIRSDGTCPPDTLNAVAGSAVLVANGQPTQLPRNTPNNDGLYSRTAVGIDETGTKLWIVAIDDKQAFYSEGVTLKELTDLFLKLGVDAAINLDGGGSTTLAIADEQKGAIVLNSPIHTKLPGRERPVANHIGFWVENE
ncbi:MAG TPA: phosphodiester glycosidase family protein [Oscillatoriales cyanobacterium M59_W2019_021]|nr:phosphodiester glycosidase family protein [Oscillatoriales cyanobacterium M4454_W2019_049]HIK52587.1 phosphodiester glycosidase family protein [Oscillatoriales cyanobacterium M59_W2019_021]